MPAPAELRAVPPSCVIGQGYRAAFDSLRTASALPVYHESVPVQSRTQIAEVGPPSQPVSSRPPTVGEVEAFSENTLHRLVQMDDDYLKAVFLSCDSEAGLRDLVDQDAPFSLPEPSSTTDPTQDDQSFLLLYRNETGLTSVLKQILGPRLVCFCRRMIGTQVLFDFPLDEASDLELCLASSPLPRLLLEINVATVLSEADLELIVSVLSKHGELRFIWPGIDDSGPKKRVTERWGVYAGNERLRDTEEGWSATLDEVLFQLYCQLAKNKIAGAKHLSPVQLDRSLVLLTNGRHWLIFGEKDGTALIPPFLLDGAQHAVSALIVALFLAMSIYRKDDDETYTTQMTEGERKAKDEHAGAGGSTGEPGPKRQKGEPRPVLRNLKDDVVPRPGQLAPLVPVPISPSVPERPVYTVVSIEEARRASALSFDLREVQIERLLWRRLRANEQSISRELLAFTFEHAPEIKFTKIYPLNWRQPVLFSSLDGQLVLKVVNQYVEESEPPLDSFFRDDSHEALHELLVEAAAYEHLESAAAAADDPSASATLFPSFVGYFQASGRWRRHAICTAKCGLPIEQFDLPFLASLEPQRALEKLHDLGVAHGDIHRSNLRVVGAAPSPAPSAASNSPRFEPAQPSIAFIDFGRAVLRDQVSPRAWEGAKKEDRDALSRTLRTLLKA